MERSTPMKTYSLFKQILINILLDKEPVNVEDFFRCCVNFIKEKETFPRSRKPIQYYVGMFENIC